MREISNYFYKTSGIYNRLCRYMAYMYRYDWMITPYINSENVKEDKVLDIILVKLEKNNEEIIQTGPFWSYGNKLSCLFFW